jgi:hypothetical protein
MTTDSRKMDITVCSLDAALAHVPCKPTYAIRIFSPRHYYKPGGVVRAAPLLPSDQFRHTEVYLFDDVTPGMARLNREAPIHEPTVLFDEDIARKIITDFETYSEGCEALLAHCHMGRNRSPAVAIALNDIFSLGHNSQALFNQHPATRQFVYDTMMKAAAKLGKTQAPSQERPTSESKIRIYGQRY